MQQNHIAFPSIKQFKEIVRHVNDNCSFHQINHPTLHFVGTTKIHGTNAGICRLVNGSIDDIYVQSRERIITVNSDNCGFALWVDANKKELNELFNEIATNEQASNAAENIIQIYGEWFGGNIQKGVGVSNLKKSFSCFAIRVSESAESTNWYSADKIISVTEKTTKTIPNFYNIYQFPTWHIVIDFSEPSSVQNTLVSLTNAVEEQCPVATKLLGQPYPDCMTGEGIVWHCVTKHDVIDTSSLVFKVKGEKHSVTKVKKLASANEEEIASIKEFVERTVTENRLQQGIQKMQELEIDVSQMQNISKFIQWVVADVIKEESSMIVHNGLDDKKVKSAITTAARNFYINHTNL